MKQGKKINKKKEAIFLCRFSKSLFFLLATMTTDSHVEAFCITVDKMEWKGEGDSLSRPNVINPKDYVTTHRISLMANKVDANPIKNDDRSEPLLLLRRLSSLS